MFKLLIQGIHHPVYSRKLTRPYISLSHTSMKKSTQNLEDKLERVILHGLEHGKQDKIRKSDEK